MSKMSDLPATRKDFKAGTSAQDAANVLLEKLAGFSIPDSPLPAANLVAAGNIHGRLQVQAPPLREDLRARNIAIFYKYIEFENARDYQNLEKLFHPVEFRSTTYFGGDPIAPRALSRMLRGLFRSFPDWYMTVSEIVGADSMGCAGLVTGRGTQVEEFFGRPPADHQVAIPTIHAIRVDDDGLIVEHRHSNPFEDVFKAQVMAPQAEDIQAVRAQQGYDSEAAHRAYVVALRAGAPEQDLAELRSRVETGKHMCQTLLKQTLRRCSFRAEPGDIYCKHHQTSGYGVDGLD